MKPFCHSGEEREHDTGPMVARDVSEEVDGGVIRLHVSDLASLYPSSERDNFPNFENPTNLPGPVSAFQLADSFSTSTSTSTSTDEYRVVRMLPLKNATASFPEGLRETCFATHKQQSCGLKPSEHRQFRLFPNDRQNCPGSGQPGDQR
jgi:hypothetical protein